MVHKKRTYSVLTTGFGIPYFVYKYTQSASWTSCTGFRFDHKGGVYLLLNDSFGEDSAQEYTLLKQIGKDWTGDVEVIELDSLTLGWVKDDELEAKLTKWVEQADESDCRPFTVKIDNPEDHERCYLCA